MSRMILVMNTDLDNKLSSLAFNNFAWDGKSPANSSGAIQDGVLRKSSKHHWSYHDATDKKNGRVEQNSTSESKWKYLPFKNFSNYMDVQIRKCLMKHTRMLPSSFSAIGRNLIPVKNKEVVIRKIELDSDNKFSRQKISTMSFNLCTECCIYKNVGSLEVTWIFFHITMLRLISFGQVENTLSVLDHCRTRTV